MKRVNIDVREDKLPFFFELIRQLDFAAISEDNEDEILKDQNRGMYDAIVSLQQGKGFNSDQ